MKKLFSALTILVNIICFSAQAEESIYKFAADKSTFENLSSSQQNSAIAATSELSRFINDQILGQLPEDLKKEISDMKIKILLTDKEGRDGLFIPGDNKEHTISIKLIQLQSNGIKSLLAHEFYHAIHYHVNPDELPWVREGLAQIFEYMTTGNLNGANLSAAINNPLTPLLGEYLIDEKNPAQYGHNQLYFLYLFNHCGRENLFWKITRGKLGLKGSYLIDRILADIEKSPLECRDFSESAMTFLVAKQHNKIQFLEKDTNEKNKFYISSMDITPRKVAISSESELVKIIREMPVLSSLKFSLADFKKYKVKCNECEYFYANTSFPFNVSDTPHPKEEKIDLILVKTRKK